jgi:integrase
MSTQCARKAGTVAKRGNGEGSIYYRNADRKWVGSITLSSGKRKVFYGKTRKEVQEKLKIVLHDQQQGTLVTSAPQTVDQFLTDWLENTHRRRIRPRTYERYREAVYLHIIPSLGHIQLQKLTAQQVQSFYTKKADEGLAPATIIYYHSVLHNALDTAVKWGLIFRNVCDLVAPPRKQQYEIQPLTMEQMQQLLATVRGHKWEALFTLALATGMRRGELLGLKWQDINIEAGLLQVRRVLSRVPTNMPEREHVYVEAEPKTQKSRRCQGQRFWLFLVFGEAVVKFVASLPSLTSAERRDQASRRSRCRKRRKPALPYMTRLMVFSLFTLPSVGP